MKFNFKTVLILLVGIVSVSYFLFPDFKNFVQKNLFLNATIDKLEQSVTLSAEEMDVELKGINVPDTNLKQMKGNVIFLNFWGTWCPPCREEWPSIQKLYESQNKDIKFVLIAMQDKEEAVINFVKENHYTAPVYIAKSPLDPKLLPDVFPTTYIVAKNGQIVMKKDASRDWNSEEVHTFINQISK